MEWNIFEETPTAQEYVELRSKCGLAKRTIEAASLGLPRSLYSVIIRSRGKLVAMGRLVGDLGCHVQVTDIAVHPEFQKKGLGNLIMNKIMKFVRKECPDCCYVNLFSNVDFLYEKHGFVLPQRSKGMHLDWKKLKPGCAL